MPRRYYDHRRHNRGRQSSHWSRKTTARTCCIHPLAQSHGFWLTPKGSVTLEATVSELSVDKHSNLDRVEVIVGNEDVEAERTMTKQSGDTYSATVDTASIDPGTYNVYAVVRGDETVRQRDEVLGVSDTVELTIEEASTATESSDGGSGAAGGGGSSVDSTATPTSTDTVTATSTANQTETAVETQTDRTPTTATDSTDTTTERESNTEQPTASPGTTTDAPTSSDGVLEPSSPSPEPSTGGSGPGFTMLVTVLVIVGSMFLAHRRK